VLEAMPDARLWFAGPDQGQFAEGGRRWDLEGFVDDRLPGARASGQVRLLGKVPKSELAGLRRAALVSVVCSRYENFPYAATEAMTMGCPLVASRVGGIPEIVRDGVDGLLHRNGDPADLAAQIVVVMGDPARAADLGRNAAARCAREFHPIAIASRTVDCYRQLLRTTTHSHATGKTSCSM
jgi:glycosyltransferase involved in cell wall biosynthesis